jgi:hypothetical protein
MFLDSMSCVVEGSAHEIDCDARVVTDCRVAASQSVKNRTFPSVGVPDDRERECSNSVDSDGGCVHRMTRGRFIRIAMESDDQSINSI